MAWPFGVTMMLDGFRSRWTSPCAWAWPRPSATSANSRAARATPSGPCSLDQSAQAHAADVLHGDVVDAADVADLVGLGQVRVADALGHVHLAQEPGEHSVLFAGPLGRQHLEGDECLVLLPALSLADVAGQVDRAHAAFAERRQDVVRAEDQPLPGPLLELGHLEMRERPRVRRGTRRACPGREPSALAPIQLAESI